MGKPAMMALAIVTLMGGCSAGQERAAAGAAASQTDVPPLHSRSAPPGTGGIMAPPGDAEAAIRAQYEEAVKAGTQAAYRLFADRHPGHPLGVEAARRADRLRDDPPRP